MVHCINVWGVYTGRIMDKQNTIGVMGGPKFIYKRDKANVSMSVIRGNQTKFYGTLESIPKPDKVEFIEVLFGVRLIHKELLDTALGGIMYVGAGKPYINKFTMNHMLRIAPIEFLPVVDDIMKKSVANLQDAANALVYLTQAELPDIKELERYITELKQIEYEEVRLLQPAPKQHKFYECLRPHYINAHGYTDGFYCRKLHVRGR